MLTNELGIGVRGLVASCGYYRSSYSNQQIYGMCYSGFLWGHICFLVCKLCYLKSLVLRDFFHEQQCASTQKCSLPAEIVGVFLLLIS